MPLDQPFGWVGASRTMPLDQPFGSVAGTAHEPRSRVTARNVGVTWPWRAAAKATKLAQGPDRAP
jgi:hypothetical protein